jgi:hypothetical protein
MRGVVVFAPEAPERDRLIAAERRITMTNGPRSSPDERRRTPDAPVSAQTQERSTAASPKQDSSEAEPPAAAEAESPAGSVAVDHGEAHLGATEAGG